jgi:hypothetical protein
MKPVGEQIARDSQGIEDRGDKEEVKRVEQVPHL